MLKDIILDCLQMLGEREVRNKVTELSHGGTVDKELSHLTVHEQDMVKLLISCSLNVVNAVTRNLIKSLAMENVKSDYDGRIYFKDLDHSIISVKDVRDELNAPIVFHVFFDHLRVPLKNKELTVSYYFEHKPLNSMYESYDLPLSLTNHIVALGALSEYCALKLLYNEAEMFESKFKAELEDAAVQKGERKFPTWRRW